MKLTLQSLIGALFFLSVEAGATADSPTPLRLRVLSYNIHHAEGVDRQLDLERIARVINEVRPDVVALQEVDQGVTRTRGVDQPAELSRLTKMAVVFGDNIRFGGGKYGNAVLSRFPIAGHRNHRLPNRDDGEQRGVIEAQIVIPESPQPLVLFATHLDHREDDQERFESAQAINALTAKHESFPALLAGDLNDTIDSRTLRESAKQWTPANAKPLFTVPVEEPDRQIDFILFRPADRWKTVEVQVLPEAVASDHRAVLAMLELRPAAATHRTTTIEGWTVHVSHELLENEKTDTERALELLTVQLREIRHVVPARAVAELRKVPLWFSPQYPRVRQRAEYHPGADWLRENNRDPAMVKAVEFTNVRIFERETKRMPNFALHELAHAYHDRVLPKGFGNEQIKAAFEKVKAKKLYEKVERRFGDGRSSTERAYAMTNPMEYFAECSEAFFSTNDFFPFTRKELEKHDPEMFALLKTLWSPAGPESGPADKPAPKLKAAELGSTRNVHSFGKTLLCGQPSAEDLAEAKKRGIKVVLTLRTKGEVNWDEAGTVKDLGLEFHRLGFRAPDTLTDSIFDGSLKILANAGEQPVMLHCASANRVGAVWLAHRVLNDGLKVEDARKEAVTVGLRTAGYEERALDYIRRKQAEEKSVRPGINKRFLDPKLNVAEWLGRFEVESREVFAHRAEVVKACGIRPGQHVADIGAGTGFFSRMFAASVGSEGKVSAVDISPRFLEHIARKARAEKVTNLATVQCTDRSARLPPESVDVAFVCDTYHHFEYPSSTLKSIHRALKPGGTLIVIDFERIPGKSREFILNHVRAGKDVFRGEIESAGFKLVEEVRIPGFKENYFLRFSKRDDR